MIAKLNLSRISLEFQIGIMFYEDSSSTEGPLFLVLKTKKTYRKKHVFTAALPDVYKIIIKQSFLGRKILMSEHH